ncbi:hypothetical protein TNCV_3648891 [Trichonephila clavipes]|nr:hypothetical protein TNCV_3648891 [Trichonephila clavipes]
MPWEMYGRRKVREGFYDSVFKKPDLWEEGIEFDNGLGKDVWGIIQRYLKGDLVWFHIMVKHNNFDTFYEMYALSRKQQNMLKEIKKVKQEWVMDQKRILSAKLNEMKAKNDLIQREKDIWKKENDVLKTKEQEWKTKENE